MEQWDLVLANTEFLVGKATESDPITGVGIFQKHKRKELLKNHEKERRS
jgi:hypothetical protein